MKTSLVTRIHSATSLTVDRDRMIDFMGENARVYATPMLVRDIETACRDLLLAHLDPREDAVGTRVEIDQIAATLLGLAVDIPVTLSELNGRAAIFEIEAHDSVEPICRGRHSRLIVDVAKTAQRFAAKGKRRRLLNPPPDKDCHES